MPVIRSSARSNFTVLPNAIIRDKALSPNALALLVCMLSFPDDWHFSLTWLRANHLEMSRAAMTAAFRELHAKGFAERYRMRTADGQVGRYDYRVFDEPQKRPETAKSVSPAVGNPAAGNPTTTKNEETKRAEKPNGFSALRQQTQASPRKQEPGRFSSGKVSSSEPVSPAPPERKLSANQQFIKWAGETWNEARHPSWPECDVRRPTKRAVKYLQALFASEGKDPERALETVRLGLRWIRSKDEWASGQVFTFEQMLANEKLESAASKARHALATASSRVDATDSIGGTPATRSGRVSSIQVGHAYHRKGTTETVRVIEDLLGNGQVFEVEYPDTGETLKLSYYELHPIHNVASA